MSISKAIKQTWTFQHPSRKRYDYTSIGIIITNSQYDQLPVGLIAQLVEHCTGVAEVMRSNPVQPF